MGSIEGQARASHSWNLQSSPHQGEQAGSYFNRNMPARQFQHQSHACKWTNVCSMEVYALTWLCGIASMGIAWV